ncbi:transmembrane protein 171 [Caretta caretta]|uniref:transmembrane protein 171 n=1 Tax=Caretta caretta TaxID=8467 RepID=UPI0020956D45|nr:transmembrane protein 171 [Caretta caretta]XP_048705296.1 transmembrane protein 171 [Caretta caretta]
MCAVAVSRPGGEGNNGHHRKFFFLFVFGVALLCTGFLLSVFILQTCPSGTFSDCNRALKIAGPVVVVVGLVCVLLAQSRARLYLSQRQMQGEQVYSLIFCQGNCQVAQFLIFGFLFLTSGVLISFLGIWVPGCSPGRHSLQYNQTSTSDVELSGCGFLPLQIMGPLIVLIGLSFFVIAHIKKKTNLNLSQESSENGEQPQSPESFQVTAGDAVMTFPPLPPPYFADSLSPHVTHKPLATELPMSENPPSYDSIVNNGAQLEHVQGMVSVREYEPPYAIPGSSSSSDILPTLHLSSELPPRYEEKEATVNTEYSSGSSMA